MKISKESWHYKLLDKFKIYPTNLCSYFWTVILVLSFIILISIVLTYGEYTYLKFAWENKCPIGECLFLLDMNGVGFVAFLINFLLILAFLSAGVVMSLSLVFGFLVTLVESILFLNYLKAKKQKICPKIEFVDKEERK